MDDHDYYQRSSYFHEYEDVPMNDPKSNPPAGISSTPLSTGDRVQVGGPLGGYGTVECTFTTDSSVKVRMDATHKFIVFHESNIEIIEKGKGSK